LRHYVTGFQDELKINYCHLAAVSVDAPEVCAAFRTGLGATFAFLSDHDRAAITALDIVEVDTPHGDVAVPYSFSLAPDLTIHRIYNGWWFVGRPTVEELRHDLRAIMQACRPDYSYAGPAVGAVPAR
jgi:peroxiredoxin